MKSIKKSLLVSYCTLFYLTVGAVNLAHAQSMPAYKPYAGADGYQEIAIGANAWYLAFHGLRSNSIPSLEKAWSARAGQLCLAAAKSTFVELRYVAERILTSDPILSENEIGSAKLHPAAAVYIPIFIPNTSGPITDGMFSSPSKMAPFKCIDDLEELMDKTRAISSSQAVENAKKYGISIRGE